MRTLILLFFFQVASKNTWAQHNLQGLVRDTAGLPIAGATIQVASKQTTVLSDQNGVFNFNVKGRSVELNVLSLGFESKVVRIAKSDFQHIEIILSPKTKELEPVVISASAKTIRCIYRTFCSYTCKGIAIREKPSFSDYEMVKPKAAKLFPNPTNGNTTFQVAEEITDLFLTDASGKLLQKLNPINIINKNVHIDVSVYPAGNYLLIYKNKKGLTSMEKLIKL